MAFNPFHAFRKYSKTMFAVLAIICMLTFVLSSGLSGKGNDFFTAIPEMFGGESKYPEIARLDGKYKLTQNRDAADREGVCAALEREGREDLARLMEKP